MHVFLFILPALSKNIRSTTQSMRGDKELSVGQIISSWLRLHSHTVNNLINTSLQTAHTPPTGCRPTRTNAHAHTQSLYYHHMYQVL